MTEHLQISVGFLAWLGKGVTVESTANRGSGLLGHLLHGARIGDAVEEQRVYALLLDLSGESRQLGRGRLAVVGPTIDGQQRNAVGLRQILQRIVRGQNTPLCGRQRGDLGLGPGVDSLQFLDVGIRARTIFRGIAWIAFARAVAMFRT